MHEHHNTAISCSPPAENTEQREEGRSGGKETELGL